MYLRKLSCCSVSAVFRHCSPSFAGRVSDFLFRVINLRPGLNQTSNAATQPRSQPCDVITRTSHSSVMYYVVRPRANESQNYTRGDTILFFPPTNVKMVETAFEKARSIRLPCDWFSRKFTWHSITWIYGFTDFLVDYKVTVCWY